MRCDQVQERLSEYIENLLDAENHTSVHDHLSSCPHCQAEAQALVQTRLVVANLPSVEPPPGFSQSIMARIREEADRPSLWQRLFLPIRIKIPIHTMAILLVGGLAVYLYQVNKPVETGVATFIPSDPKTSFEQGLNTQPPPASPPPSSPSERKSREMDETTLTSPGGRQGPGILQAEKKSKLEASGKSPAKEMPARKALSALSSVRELAFT
ncbi:MAG: DUF2275 domain-containing protein, partial [Nitrospira sp.]|nr:DUF2275 domain-containing protein [Nitrospira sp.]